MTMKKCFITFSISLMLLFNSCIVGEKVIYIRDMLPDTLYSALKAPALHVQESDRLSIVISAKTPELAAPFNPGADSYQVNEQRNVSTGSSNAWDTKGYLVDDQGEIDFPILGTLNVEGLTLNQVKDTLKRRLVDEKLITNPIVRVELLNLKINMMGEVNSVGMLSVPDGRITLLEAITRAGGLTINAAADKITVIREEGGVRRMIVNDIRSKDIFSSPSYYLQQNDIVYIEARDAVSTPKVQNNWRYIGTGIGLLATVFTILNFLK